jgi:hypothetical protein
MKEYSIVPNCALIIPSRYKKEREKIIKNSYNKKFQE